MQYYTEFPTSKFTANSDEEALASTAAKVVYKDSNPGDKKPYILLRITR